MATNVSASNSFIKYSPPDAWVVKDDGPVTTITAGATAEFSFDGSFVQVFGTIPARNNTAPISTYTLDGIASPPFDPAALLDVRTLYDQVFYQSSPELLSGNHSLIINSTQAGAQFILGSIIFAPSFSPSISAFPSVTPPSSPSSTTNAATTSHKIIVGRLVGGLLATFIILAAEIAFLFYRRRRKQKTTEGNRWDS
ncbi:hypothetical protein GYMLUDRAFT_77314 [Collybiopsis luxurians FD-317 M1]|uniref:Uncharacterized protein n=1 Tax=Collybiopsis luxurians FD-317 M1 TaxID=944289 RepID=A0A0D0BGS0_9AGAR|nr:hypothetical protein GYMLUDRAFT_77314 [Collybiopsis luxurians FD-317 M1]